MGEEVVELIDFTMVEVNAAEALDAPPSSFRATVIVSSVAVVTATPLPPTVVGMVEVAFTPVFTEGIKGAEEVTGESCCGSGMQSGEDDDVGECDSGSRWAGSDEAVARLGSMLWWVVSVRAQNMAVRAPRLALASPPIADAKAIRSCSLV